MDAAINHYIEAGRSFKAIEAAIGAKQVLSNTQIRVDGTYEITLVEKSCRYRRLLRST
jgi:hypothetical protein